MLTKVRQKVSKRYRRETKLKLKFHQVSDETNGEEQIRVLQRKDKYDYSQEIQQCEEKSEYATVRRQIRTEGWEKSKILPSSDDNGRLKYNLGDELMTNQSIQEAKCPGMVNDFNRCWCKQQS